MKWTKVIMAGVCMLAAVGASYGSSIFSEDFESYTAGSGIKGQNGFRTINRTASQNESVVAIGSPFKGGSNSLFISDKDTTSSLGNMLVEKKIELPAGPLVFFFDFNVTKNKQNPSFAVNEGMEPVFKLNFFNLSGKVYNLLSATQQVEISPYMLSTGLWYHAEITIGDLSNADSYALRIMEETSDGGKEVINVPAIPLRNKGKTFTSFNFGAAGGLGMAGSAFYIDNIQITQP